MSAYFNYYIKALENRPLEEIIIVNAGYNRKNERDSIPETISECYIPLRKIRYEKLYNDLYQKNITILMDQFSAWKKSRGDGNCYYRSVISSFLIKLFFYKTSDEKIESFIAKISQVYNIDYYSQQKHTIGEFWSKINELLKQRKYSPQGKYQAFINIHKELQKKEFDYSAILVGRIISHLTLWASNDKYANFFLEGELEVLLVNIMEMGREAESQELYFLPEGLGIEVTQINIFDNLLETHYPEKDTTGEKIKVSIISKSKGHYDCLYSKAEMEYEGYYMKNRAYRYLPSS